MVAVPTHAPFLHLKNRRTFEMEIHSKYYPKEQTFSKVRSKRTKLYFQVIYNEPMHLKGATRVATEVEKETSLD